VIVDTGVLVAAANRKNRRTRDAETYWPASLRSSCRPS